MVASDFCSVGEFFWEGVFTSVLVPPHAAHDEIQSAGHDKGSVFAELFHQTLPLKAFNAPQDYVVRPNGKAHRRHPPCKA